ncbi:MAG: prolipoprotein diacylglyceryl transferase [Steroidobacteraceae bacterium]
MLTYPGFDPIAFSLGPVRVHWYGIMYVIGFAAAWWLARRRAAQPGSTWTAVDVDDLIFFGMLGVILGGRIGYLLFYSEGLWLREPLYILQIWKGGMSFHGGLAGVIVALALFARRRKRHVADVFDFTAAVPGVGLFAGRIGNFINGELWGKPTDVPWGFMVNGQVRHATPCGLSAAPWAWCCSRCCGEEVHVDAAASTRRVQAVPRAVRHRADDRRVLAAAG